MDGGRRRQSDLTVAHQVAAETLWQSAEACAVGTNMDANSALIRPIPDDLQRARRVDRCDGFFKFLQDWMGHFAPQQHETAGLAPQGGQQDARGKQRP